MSKNRIDLWLVLLVLLGLGSILYSCSRVLDKGVSILPSVRVNEAKRDTAKYGAEEQEEKRREIEAIVAPQVLDEHEDLERLRLDFIEEMFDKANLWNIVQRHDQNREERLMESYHEREMARLWRSVWMGLGTLLGLLVLAVVGPPALYRLKRAIDLFLGTGDNEGRRW